MVDDKVILGFETSCDETAIAIMKDNKLLVNKISSQVDIHEKFGGVVPEVASRAHSEMIRNLFHTSLNEAHLELSDIDIVASTDGPGLVGSLVVGYNFAKSVAWSLDKPFLPIDHMVGHLSAPLIEHPQLDPPFLSLLVSGGHSQFLIAKGLNNYKQIGTTIDDAVGEAFDKVGKLLQLPYPGGPHIEEAAKNGDPVKYDFPRPMKNSDDLNLSFSGLKTAVLYATKDLDINEERSNISASFQEAVIDVLSTKIKKAMKQTGNKSLIRKSRLLSASTPYFLTPAKILVIPSWL